MTFSRLVEKIAICRCASEQSLRWNVLWYWFYLSSYHFAVYGLHEIHFSAAEFGLFNALFQQSAKRSVNVAVVCSANAFDSSDCKQFASLIQRDRVDYICLVFCTRLLQRKKEIYFGGTLIWLQLRLCEHWLQWITCLPVIVHWIGCLQATNCDVMLDVCFALCFVESMIESIVLCIHLFRNKMASWVNSLMRVIGVVFDDCTGWRNCVVWVRSQASL